MGGIRFDEQVAAALEALPDELRAAMSNVELVVEDENPDDPDVYGLYTGIPLTERDSGYAGVLPDKIEIYRIPLEEEFGHDPDLLVEEIRITVIHELAHHFGIDDDRLEDLGWGVRPAAKRAAQRPRRRPARSASGRSPRIRKPAEGGRAAAAPKAPGREAQPAPPAYRKPAAGERAADASSRRASDAKSLRADASHALGELYELGARRPATDEPDLDALLAPVEREPECRPPAAGALTVLVERRLLAMDPELCDDGGVAEVTAVEGLALVDRELPSLSGPVGRVELLCRLPAVDVLRSHPFQCHSEGLRRCKDGHVEFPGGIRPAGVGAGTG